MTDAPYLTEVGQVNNVGIDIDKDPRKEDGVRITLVNIKCYTQYLSLSQAKELSEIIIEAINRLESPTEDVGCALSDAMGGEEPDRHFDTATVDPHKQWEAPSRRLEVPTEEPEKEVEEVDLFRMGGITYFAEVPKKEVK